MTRRSDNPLESNEVAWVDDAQPIAMVLDRWSHFALGCGARVDLAGSAMSADTVFAA